MTLKSLCATHVTLNKSDALVKVSATCRSPFTNENSPSILGAMPNKKKKGFRCASLGYTTTELKHTKRSSVRKQWSEEKTLAALQSVENQFLSGNKATDLHGVPRSTLKDRLTGWVMHGTRPEPKPYLSMTEEADLFRSVLQTAWLNAVIPAVIFGGFKKAGVFPFDRNAVHPHDKVVTQW